MPFNPQMYASWKVNLNVSLRNNCFYPGNIVEGVVTIDNPSPIDFTAIRLKICGKEKIHIQRKERVQNGEEVTYVTRHFPSTNVIFKQLITLAGCFKYAGMGPTLHMPAGRYSYPFAIQLPMGLPPSFNRTISDDNANVIYYAKAYVDVPNGRDAIYKHFFSVVRPMPQNQWLTRDHVSVTRSFDITCCCCVNKGKVNATISMDRTCIAMDRDYLQVFADIENSLGEEPVENIYVTLRHSLRYSAMGINECHSYVAGNEALGNIIQPGQKGIVNGVIDLPRNLIPTFTTPGIKSSYTITIGFSIPWADDPAQSWPVVVGQSVDDTNASPPIYFNEVGSTPFLGARNQCPEYFYQPPQQAIAPYNPVPSWAPPSNAVFFGLPNMSMSVGLPPPSWATGNPPPAPLGQPASFQIQWQGGYGQHQASEYQMAPPNSQPMRAGATPLPPQQHGGHQLPQQSPVNNFSPVNSPQRGLPPQQQQQQQQVSHHGPSVALYAGMAINVQFDNGRFLRAQPDGSFDDDADRAAEWERFTLEQAGANDFALRTAHGKVVCWDQGDQRMEARDAVGDWERFEFRPAGQGKFQWFSPAHNVYIHGGGGIRSAPHPELVTIISLGGTAAHGSTAQHGNSFTLSAGTAITVRFDNGRFLRAQPDGSFDDDADRAAEWERFTLEQAGPNAFALRTAHGKVVCWDQGDQRMEARDAVGDWERFEFRPAGQGKFQWFSPAHNVYIHGGGGIRSAPHPELVAIISLGGSFDHPNAPQH